MLLNGQRPVWKRRKRTCLKLNSLSLSLFWQAIVRLLVKLFSFLAKKSKQKEAPVKILLLLYSLKRGRFLACSFRVMRVPSHRSDEILSLYLLNEFSILLAICWLLENLQEGDHATQKKPTQLGLPNGILSLGWCHMDSRFEHHFYVCFISSHRSCSQSIEDLILGLQKEHCNPLGFWVKHFFEVVLVECRLKKTSLTMKHPSVTSRLFRLLVNRLNNGVLLFLEFGKSLPSRACSKLTGSSSAESFRNLNFKESLKFSERKLDPWSNFSRNITKLLSKIICN